MLVTTIKARARRQVVKAERLARRALERFHQSTLPADLGAVAVRVRAEGLTYLSPPKLDKLGHALLRVKAGKVPGLLLETGCALGGSAIVLGTAKEPERRLRVYDVFGMIPPPGEKDDQDVHDRYRVIASGKSKGLRGNRYYGYESDLYQRVRQSFTRFGLAPDEHNIEMIAGRIEDTLVVDDAVALAHIDVDWYDPVMVSLERIAPRLSPGGIIILDDYFDWSGCRKATDDFLKQTQVPLVRDPSAGSMALIRA
jgi:predicted O-methyltransferase YrrM